MCLHTDTGLCARVFSPFFFLFLLARHENFCFALNAFSARFVLSVCVCVCVCLSMCECTSATVGRERHQFGLIIYFSSVEKVK